MIILGLGFATELVISRALGPEMRGMYALALVVAGLCVQFSDLGLTTATTYAVAKSPERSSGAFSNGVLASLSICLVLVVLILTLRLALPANPLLGLDDTLTAMVMLLAGVTIVWNYVTAVILGQYAVRVMNSMAVFQAGLALLLTGVFLICGGLTVGSALLAQILAKLPSCWYGWSRTRVPLALRPSRELLRQSLGYAYKEYISNLASFLSYRADQAIIFGIAGSVQLGYYAVATSITERLALIPGALSTVLMPATALNRDGSSLTTTRAVRLTFASTSVLAACLAVAASPMIYVAYGASFSAAVMPLLSLLPGIVALSVSKVLAADLAGRGRPEFSMYSSLAAAAVMLPLAILLVPRLGIAGAGIASSIAYGVAAAAFVAAFSRQTGVSPHRVLMYRLGDLSSTATGLRNRLASYLR